MTRSTARAADIARKRDHGRLVSGIRLWVTLCCMSAAGCPTSKPAAAHAPKKDAGIDHFSVATKHHAGDAGSHNNDDVFALYARQHDGALPEDAGGGAAGSASRLPHADASQVDGSPGSVPDEGAPDAGVVDSGTRVQPPDQPEVSSDPGVRGPWPVGVRTLMLDLGTGQHIPVEVWYPARIGSEADQTKETYDFIDWLSPEAKAMLPSGEIPVAVPCDCYRDLPIDGDHGPYPISIAVHHTGAFRVVSSSLMAHWASRGYVVLAADHPKLNLADVLSEMSNGRCSGSGISADSDYTRDLPALLRTLRQPAGEFAFLADKLDTSRIAISGNGDGGQYAAAASGEAGVRLIMQWDSSVAVPKRGDLQAVVFVTGIGDQYSAPTYASVQTAFQTTAQRITPTLLVGVANASHLSMTAICSAHSPMGRNGMELSQKYGLCGINFDLASAIFPCNSTQISQAQADLIYSYTTTAALDEFVMGKDERAAWTGFKSEWGEVRASR